MRGGRVSEMTMACLHCGATTSNGLALCERCRIAVSVVLEFLPIYFRNLARWRPGRAGSRPVPGSRVLYDGEARGVGTGDKISDRLDEATNALTTWARTLADDRPDFPRPLTFTDAVLAGDLPPATAEALADDQPRVIVALCHAFTDHLTSIGTLGWAGEFVRDLSHHESVLRGLTEQSVPGWYAGACARRVSMESTCGAATYVVPGLTWVTCGTCGTTTYARDHLETILDEARDWIDRPRRLAEAAVALIDTEVSVPKLYERIKKWEQREKIAGIRRLDSDGDPVGPKRYRFGEVLDRVFSEGATRHDDAMSDTAAAS
jgi:hypothetical protein